VYRLMLRYFVEVQNVERQKFVILPWFTTEIVHFLLGHSASILVLHFLLQHIITQMHCAKYFITCF
jgi:hypothetical protein